MLAAANIVTTWDRRLVEFSVDLGLLVIVAGMFLCLVRLVRGPHTADRAIALDTIAIHVIGLVILLTLRIDSLVLFDGALVLSLLGFAGTVAVAQYITRVHRGRHGRAVEAAGAAQPEERP